MQQYSPPVVSAQVLLLRYPVRPSAPLFSPLAPEGKEKRVESRKEEEEEEEEKEEEEEEGGRRRKRRREGVGDSERSTFLWCSRSSSVCDLLCSCFSRSEILKGSERREGRR